MRISEKFELHSTLNPKIWDANNQLRPLVRERITDIITAFQDGLDFPMNIVDVQLVGSSASYNYTSHSDLDVHIMVSFDNTDLSKELLLAYFNKERSDFNLRMPITIYGIDVELFVQDINSVTASNGIYSVLFNQWVKFPQPIKAPDFDTTVEVGKWQSKIESALNNMNYDEINNTINSLYLMRTNAIAVDGEYSKGNQIFKDIRNLGLLDRLKDALKQSLGKKLSLEDLNRGELINFDID